MYAMVGFSRLFGLGDGLGSYTPKIHAVLKFKLTGVTIRNVPDALVLPNGTFGILVNVDLRRRSLPTPLSSTKMPSGRYRIIAVEWKIITMSLPSRSAYTLLESLRRFLLPREDCVKTVKRVRTSVIGFRHDSVLRGCLV